MKDISIELGETDSRQPAVERRISRSDSIKQAFTEATKSKSSFVQHEDEEQSYMKMAQTGALAAFVNGLPLPVLSTLSVSRMIVFGFFAYLIYIVTFLNFSINGFKQLIKEEFVSLKSDAGVCEHVTKPVTGFFLASADGKWQGSEDFKYNLAAYEFYFTSLETDDTGFAEELQKLKENELTAIGNRQAVSSLSDNLLLWMHFSSTFIVGNKVQTFGFTAEPGDVFSREYELFQMSGSIDNVSHVCSATAITTLDKNFARNQIQFPYDENDENDLYTTMSCADLLPPENFGYDSFYDGKDFSFEMDLTTLTSAMSINLGFTNTLAFEGTSGDIYLGKYNTNSEVYLRSLFDTRFPRMQPILCFDIVDCETSVCDGDGDDDYDNEVNLGSGPDHFEGKCVMRIGSELVIPAFSLWNSNCQKCPVDGTPTDSDCDEFDFVSTFLYFPNDNYANTIKILNDYEDLTTLNDAVYNAYMTPYTWMSPDYSFCGDQNCTLISLNSYDSVNQAMSPYYYSLNKGHCRDSTQKESFDILGETPPSSLVEEYYRCKHTKTSAFFTSVGIANSNMLLFAPLICLIFLSPLVRAYHTYVVKEPLDQKGVLTAKEKAAALDEFITRLLDVTNGKDVKNDPNSTVCLLANNLNALAVRDSKASQAKMNGVNINPMRQNDSNL